MNRGIHMYNPDEHDADLSSRDAGLSDEEDPISEDEDMIEHNDLLMEDPPIDHGHMQQQPSYNNHPAHAAAQAQAAQQMHRNSHGHNMEMQPQRQAHPHGHHGHHVNPHVSTSILPFGSRNFETEISFRLTQPVPPFYFLFSLSQIQAQVQAPQAQPQPAIPAAAPELDNQPPLTPSHHYEVSFHHYLASLCIMLFCSTNEQSCF